MQSILILFSSTLGPKVFGVCLWRVLGSDPPTRDNLHTVWVLWERWSLWWQYWGVWPWD